MIKTPGTPSFLAVDSTLHRVFATDGQDTLSVVDAEPPPSVTGVDVPYGYGLDVDQSTHTVYVANYNTQTLTVMQEATDEVAATIPITGTPHAVAVDPSLHLALVVSYGFACPQTCRGTVSFVDTVTNTVTAVVTLPGQGDQVAVDTATHVAYVSNYDTDTVAVIDEASHAVTDTVHVDAPQALASDPTRHRLYVAAGPGLVVIDEASASVVDTIALPALAASFDLDPARQIGFVGLGYQAVGIVDLTADAVVQTVPLGTGVALGIRVDRSTHAVFVGHFYRLAGHRLDVITQAVRTNVTDISNTFGPVTGGQTVVISGEHFTGAKRVLFGGVPAPSFHVDSDGQITATTPAHPAGAVHVRVYTAAGGVSAQRPENRYTYES